MDALIADIGIVDAIKNGFAGAELKAEWDTLQERKTALLAEMAQLDEPEPLLHPSMGDLYREKVETLAAALESCDTTERERAKNALRGFIEKIVIPVDEAQPLVVFGNLARMLKAASAGVGADWPDWPLLLTVVAGARLPLYRKLCWAAA